MCILSQCMDCKNFIGNNEKDEYVCKAFPDGIPDDVLMSKIRHTEPIENDNGIRFEKIERPRKDRP